MSWFSDTIQSSNISGQCFPSKFLKRQFKLMIRDKTHEEDHCRKILFCIIAGDPYLFKNVDKIYNFEKHRISPSCMADPKVKAKILTRHLDNRFEC